MSQKNLTKIILIIIIVLLLGVISYFIFNKLHSKKPVATENWKIYNNSDYNFKLNYPSTWTQEWSSDPEEKKAGLLLEGEKVGLSINLNFFGDLGYLKPTNIEDIVINGVLLKKYIYSKTLSSNKHNIITTYCTEGEQNCENLFSKAKYTNIVFNLECEIIKYSKEECSALFDDIVSTFRLTSAE